MKTLFILFPNPIIESLFFFSALLILCSLPLIFRKRKKVYILDMSEELLPVRKEQKENLTEIEIEIKEMRIKHFDDLYSRLRLLEKKPISNYSLEELEEVEKFANDLNNAILYLGTSDSVKLSEDENLAQIDLSEKISSVLTKIYSRGTGLRNGRVLIA